MLKQKMLIAALATVGAFVSLEYTSLAQSNQPTTQPSPGTTRQQPITQPSPGSTGQDQPITQPSPGTSQSQPTTISAQDQQFVTQAAQGGLAEIQLGQLAQKRAASESVKGYARRMVNEHTRVNKELAQLANQKGIAVPKNVNEQQQALINKLSKLSGKRFDQVYMQEAGIRSHTEQVNLFRQQAQQGQDPDLRTFAAKTLPAVQKHLSMAQAMIGKPTMQGENMNRPTPR